MTIRSPWARKENETTDFENGFAYWPHIQIHIENLYLQLRNQLKNWTEA